MSNKRLSLEQQIAAMSDKELVKAYQETDGTPGDPYAKALLSVIHERRLDL